MSIEHYTPVAEKRRAELENPAAKRAVGYLWKACENYWAIRRESAPTPAIVKNAKYTLALTTMGYAEATGRNFGAGVLSTICDVALEATSGSLYDVPVGGANTKVPSVFTTEEWKNARTLIFAQFWESKDADTSGKHTILHLLDLIDEGKVAFPEF